MRATLVAILLLAACSPAPAPADVSSADVPPKSLIDNDIWELASGDADPFVHRQGDVVACPEPAYGPEVEGDGVWWTVETKTCAYATFGAPLQADLSFGAPITLRIWHYAITVGEGDFTITLAVAHAGGLSTLFETTRPIPSESGLIYEQFESPFAAKQGDTLYFHLSNHGDNEWGLIELSVGGG
jgi:hypothetical protein